jgi:SAM-dependent methyltransferase
MATARSEARVEDPDISDGVDARSHGRRAMAPTAAYDEIADWYENEFLGGQSTGARTRDGTPLDLDSVLRNLLGEGSGACLEIGCGTGVHATHVRKLGWTPIGVDLSAGMLRHARGRLPTDQGVRAKVGATHRPLPELMHAFVAAGLQLERFAESGEPTPIVLAIKARKSTEERLDSQPSDST